MRRVNFIGLGAQKAGTSWIAACLAEHPEICIPLKELHFFSRERHWKQGVEWYETRFERCGDVPCSGEFCTSYLYSDEAPSRIHETYPDVKLIACLRDPVDRAFSNYVNDIMAGRVSRETPFREALQSHPEYTEQGQYAQQLQRYFERFPRQNILVLIYEDCRQNPGEFLRSMFEFLQVDPTFVPPSLHQRVNPARIPRSMPFDHALNWASDKMRRAGMTGLVTAIKRTRIPDRVRALNSRRVSSDRLRISPRDRASLKDLFACDVLELEHLLGRELHPWSG